MTKTKQEILDEIKHAENEFDLHIARKEVNYYQTHSGDEKGYKELDRAHHNKSEQITNPRKYSR